MLQTTVEPQFPPTATAMDPRQRYQARVTELQSAASKLQSSERRFVRFRVAVFLIAVFLGSICIGDRNVSWLWMLLPGTAFLVLLPLHSGCIRSLRRCEAAIAFHQGCLQRLDNSWKHRPVDGARYGDPAHPWVADLDIFGPGSLFQLMTECRTGPGHDRLAGWMKTTPELKEILTRQQRSEALKPELELREMLALVPGNVDWKVAEQLLTQWVRSPAQRIPQWILWASAALGILAIPLLAAVLLGAIPVSLLLLPMILQGPLMLLTRQQIQQVFSSMDSADHALHQFAEVLVLFENHPFLDPSLRDLQNEFMGHGEAASVAIRRLSSMTRWLNHSLRNQFFSPIAWMCGLLVLLTDRLERWRAEHGHDVERWLSSTAEFEALLSVAAFRFERTGYCNPLVTTEMVLFDAQQIGHPLLPSEGCIRNNVRLTTEVPLILISGSNMSGKSTLLRSVGTNLVLVFCGAVVNAAQLTTFPFQMGTAMRISDSLQEGRSLFYSVVQRLKSVVDLTLQPRTVLFLLDEILNGTNSHDRRRGAEAVIRSLVDRHALGMVTTHDLALTQIVDSMDGRAINQHFEDTVQDGKMTFDYQLRDGVVQRSNALELMRMLGLDV